MKYYKYLYLGEGLENKKEKLKEKLDSRHFLPGIQLIVLSQGKEDQLEIFSANLLLQKNLSKDSLFVVGITKDFGEALEIVEGILHTVYNETGGTDMRSYILKKEQDD